MRDRIERRKRIRKIGALVVLGIFVATMVIPAPVVAQSDNDWNFVGINSLAMGYPTADRSGNCGIGTDSPTSKLHVVGDVKIDSGDLNVDSGTLFVDNNNNRVGIGTTTPGAKLDVEVSSGGAATIGNYQCSATGDYAIAMGYGTTAIGEYSTAMGWDTTAIGDYSTAMGGQDTEASGEGSIAIGYMAEASGFVSQAIGMDVEASGVYSCAIGSWVTAGPAYSTYVIGRGMDWDNRLVNNIEKSFMVGFDSTTPTLFVDGSSVGIGTTNPGAKLDVQDSTNPQLRLTQSDAFYTDLQTISSGYLYINPSGGRVGIGTASPGAALDVDPTVSITTDYIGIRSHMIFNPVSGTMNNCYGAYIAAPIVNSGSITNKYALVTEVDAGKVGIGTTSPQEKLTLGSDSNFATEVAAPGKPTGTPRTYGGSMADGTYYYVINVLDGVGETVRGIESDPVTISGGMDSGSVVLTWTAVIGAVAYKVYRTTTQGVYTSPAYIATTFLTSYVDVAPSPLAGAPPSSTTAYINKITASGNSWFLGGNIGIGTTLPGAKLDVRPGQSEKGIRIRAHGLPEDNLLRIEDGSGQYRWRVDQLFDMYFTTMGGEDVVRIAENGVIYFDNGGNVGIGTKSATSRLTVSGDAKISDSLNVDSGTLYVDNVNDRVGIGDTSPGAHLVVGNDANMGIADGIGDAYIQNDLEVDGNIYMGNNLVATQAWILSQGYGNGDITAVGSMTSGAAFADSTADDDWLGLGSSAGRIEFDDQTTDEVNILNAKVGIGTTSPDTKLEIIDSSGPQLRLTHTDGSYYTDFQTNLEGHLWIDPSGDVLNVGDTNTLYVNTNLDRVGISESSPYCTLGVDGNVAIGDGYANFPGPANGAIIEGDVGIGTWSPLADLHISDGGVLGFTPRDDNPSDDEGVCKLYIVEYNNPPFYTYRTYVLYLMSPQGTTEEVARVTDYF